MLAERKTQKGEITSLHILHKGETKYSVIADHLRNLPDSQNSATTKFDGRSMSFSRHENGRGWVEDGCDMSASVRVENEAVIFRDVKVYSDVIRVYGGEQGNNISYSNYC